MRLRKWLMVWMVVVMAGLLGACARGGGTAGGVATLQAGAGTVQAGVGTAQVVGATAIANATEIVATLQAGGESLEAAGATAQVVSGTAQAAATRVATQFTGTGPVAAEDAIVSYAREVLGISVDPRYAGGVSGEVERIVAQDGTDVAGTVTLAGVSYGALFEGGAATLAYGDGTFSGDFAVDINTASVGSFTFLEQGGMPGSEAEALALALARFPGVSDRPYALQPGGGAGYRWKAVSQVPGFERETFEVTTVAEVVVVGIQPGQAGNRLVIYVVVARGTFAAGLLP